jgi:hypothetical protein
MLSSFSKVYEKVLYNWLQTHLCKYSILAEKLPDFRAESSTNRAIYKFINETLQAINSKSPVGGIFLSWKSVWLFKPWHIDFKIKFYGVSGKAKLWLESYLINRYQRAQVSDEESNSTSFSTWGKNNRQCSPGIISGPSVVCYLYQWFAQNSVILFADDTSIFVKGSSSGDFWNKMSLTSPRA